LLASHFLIFSYSHLSQSNSIFIYTTTILYNKLYTNINLDIFIISFKFNLYANTFINNNNNNKKCSGEAKLAPMIFFFVYFAIFFSIRVCVCAVQIKKTKKGVVKYIYEKKKYKKKRGNNNTNIMRLYSLIKRNIFYWWFIDWLNISMPNNLVKINISVTCFAHFAPLSKIE
jgi:hypothetical protein